MDQVLVKMSTYTADVSGVCSALYELGGMVVIHDPSGCNSTYNTHDEPRWYSMDSLVFISGLKEIDAIMGNDDKFIRDVEEAAQQLKPRFIALVRTPVPMMIGTDFEAIAAMIEEDTGITTFYVPTNGMHSYIDGAGAAFEKLARLMTDEISGKPARDPADGSICVNLLGVTPLDFSVGSMVASMKDFVADSGFRLVSCVAMGSSPEEIARAGSADVNIVVSSTGFRAAQVLKDRFGTPWVVGTPCGGFGAAVAADVRRAAASGEDIISYDSAQMPEMKYRAGYYIIGELVTSSSAAAALMMRDGEAPQVICPLEPPAELRKEPAAFIRAENAIRERLADAGTVIADPMYKRLCPDGAQLIAVPHEAYSGRIYRKQIPDMIKLEI